MENKYEYKKNFLNFQIYDYDSFYQNIELALLTTLSFLLPIIIGHPQLFIGSIINALLFRSALSMNFKRALPIILLPSLGVIAGGLLFGNLTNFVIYFVPFIWLGNAIYVLTAKYISHHWEKNYGASVVASSMIKTGLLFSAAFVMVKFFSFPVAFLTLMGTFQLITAIIGGIGALGITKVELALKNR